MEKPVAIASLGVIRQGRAHIHIHTADGSPFDPGAWQFIVYVNGGEPISATARRFDAHSPTQLRAVVPLPNTEILAVRTFGTRGAEQSELEYGRDYELLNLMPAPAGHIDSIFIKSKRIRDLDTLRFQANQINRSPQYTLPVKVEVLKILSYAAMENLDSAEMEACLDQIDQFLALNYNVGHKGHSKLNPDHIAVSMKFIRLNLLLLLKRFDAYLTGSDDLRSYVPLVAEAPIAAFNLSIALLVKAWILLRSGNEAAVAQISREVVECFRLAAWNMPAKKSKGYSELIMSLNAATYAISLLNYADKSEGPDWQANDSAGRLAERFSRLSTAISLGAIAMAYEEAAEFQAGLTGATSDAI